jgi:hypothetical protein
MSTTYLTFSRIERLNRQMSDRDWLVISTLARVRVATGHQLRRLHFADVSARQARSGLAGLVSRRLLARLPRVVGGVRAGSAGYVYVLDVAGQRLTRAATGRAQRPWPVGTPFLAHSLAVTELYVQLSEATRTMSSSADLVDFRAEPACWRDFTGPGAARIALKPDAEVVLGVGRYYEDCWFIEIDRATESRPTLARKLQRYVQYWQTGREQTKAGVFPRVLWIVPDAARHAVLIDEFGRTPVAAWPLFAVTTEAEALGRLLAGAQL